MTDIEILVSDDQADEIIDSQLLARLAHDVLEDRGILSACELSLCFVNEETIAELNQSYRNHQGPTDVLSFAIDEYGDGGSENSPINAPTMLGDIVVCPAVASCNAKEHQVTLEQELSLLVVHGVLHILGMDHEEDDDAIEMEALEQELLVRFRQ